MPQRAVERREWQSLREIHRLVFMHGALAEMCICVYVNDVHVGNTNNLCIELRQRCAVVYMQMMCMLRKLTTSALSFGGDVQLCICK